MACSMLQKSWYHQGIQISAVLTNYKIVCSTELNWDIYARFEHRDVCLDEIV